MWYKNFKGKKKKLKYQFDSFSQQQSHTVNVETNETWPFQKHKYLCKMI